MALVKPFAFQGYKAFCDNFYSSLSLFEDLLMWGIVATGTLRRGVPDDVKTLKSAMTHKTTTRGTGYYIRESKSPIVYVSWNDNLCVTLLSTDMAVCCFLLNTKPDANIVGYMAWRTGPRVSVLVVSSHLPYAKL